MKYLKPGVAKTASVEMTVKPAGETYVLALTFAKNGSVISQPYEREFVGTGNPQLVGVEVTTPSVEDDYHTFVDLYLKTSLGDVPVYQTVQQWVSWDVLRICAVADSYAALDPEVYFDDGELPVHAFMQGTKHKLTVEFTNPTTQRLSFYVAGYPQMQVGIGNQDPFNAWGFFYVNAGARIKKELNFYASEAIGTPGPLVLKISPMGQEGLEIIIVETTPVEIINNPTPLSGTIEFVPSKTSVKQGEAFDIDIKITNTSNRLGAFPLYVMMFDKDNKWIRGIISSGYGVGPGETITAYTYIASVLYTENGINPFGYPPIGNLYIRGKFSQKDTVWRGEKTITVVSGTAPAATATVSGAAWYMPEWWWHLKGSISSSFVGVLPNGDKPYYNIYLLSYYDPGRTEYCGLNLIWGEPLNKADGAVQFDCDLGNSSQDGRYTKIVILEQGADWSIRGLKVVNGPTRPS